MTTSAEAILARNATSGGQWSRRAQELASRAILDTMAVGIGGSASDQARLAAATVHPTAPGPCELSGPWTDPNAYGILDAAYLAGTAAHALDWDDYMHPMHGHASAVLLGALFPLAQSVNADGAALVGAYLAGYQVDWLVSLAMSHSHYGRGWHATSTLGVLGAAAAASKLLGLTPGQAGHALGVAASSASGIRVNFGTTTKAFHAGSAARGGVQAALLARAGATSSPNWLTGPAGMMETLGSEHPPHEAAQILASASAEGRHGIEAPWGLVQKPYACCGSVHAAIEALLTLLKNDGIDSRDVQMITAHVDPHVTAIMRHGHPEDSHQARYSPTWALAAAATDGHAGPQQFSDAALMRGEIHALRERVRVVPDLVVDHDERFAAEVEVQTAAGTSVLRLSEASGHPRRPMSDEDLDQKALAALQLACTEDKARALLPVLRTLDARLVRDVADVIRDSVRVCATVAT
ncbi:MmgE/PrpD family protein [Intrasporangium calvum]|uniref:MmgE/PrpD family protein n=1 Tax=Intrasporangium calvum TaxID=53358 RepID=A0ABT5GLA6_9MICO|nr:MmgE/PrpD family protein [Intrasporangium calvum]MDC5698838.1 MmgE/PrpD family protein [Intrasporangium calvum]